MKLLSIFTSIFVAFPLWAGEVNPIAESNANMGFKLMSEAVKSEKKPKNVLVSPVSAHYVLSMALNGTAGKTRNKFMTTLGYPTAMRMEVINSLNHGMLKGLVKLPLSEEKIAELKKNWRPMPPVLTIENAAWSTNGATTKKPYNLKPEFAKMLNDFYAASVDSPEKLDFMNKESADKINEWVDTATNHMIPTIIDADTLSGLLWVLLNATYLEAQWQKPFAKNKTKPFTLLSNKIINPPSMKVELRTRYMNDHDVEAVELPFAAGTLSALVVMPFAKDFGRSETWSMGYWNTILKKLESKRVELTMPKFTFEYGVKLLKDQTITENLGLNFLFQDKADFSNMDEPGSPESVLGIIKQNTKIEWDEKGVKAAAATLGGGAEKTAVESALKMDVDRPFYFAIYDKEADMFLFLGQVVDPTLKK